MKFAPYISILQYVFVSTLLRAASSRALVQRSQSPESWVNEIDRMVAELPPDYEQGLSSAQWEHLLELQKASIDNESDPMEIDAPEPMEPAMPSATQQLGTPSAARPVKTLSPEGDHHLIYGSRFLPVEWSSDEGPLRLDFKCQRRSVKSCS